MTTLTHSGQPEGPLAEPASLSAPGWPHRQQQAHSTADVWLVVWPGLLVGFFCSERFLKSESGFSLSLGHESLPLGLERGRRGGRPYATGAPSHSGPPATKVRICDRLPSHTRFQARSRYLIFPPAQELHKVRIDSASPSLVPTPKLLSFSFPVDQGCSVLSLTSGSFFPLCSPALHQALASSSLGCCSNHLSHPLAPTCCPITFDFPSQHLSLPRPKKELLKTEIRTCLSPPSKAFSGSHLLHPNALDGIQCSLIGLNPFPILAVSQSTHSSVLPTKHQAVCQIILPALLAFTNNLVSTSQIPESFIWTSLTAFSTSSLVSVIYPKTFSLLLDHKPLKGPTYLLSFIP